MALGLLCVCVCLNINTQQGNLIAFVRQSFIGLFVGCVALAFEIRALCSFVARSACVCVCFVEFNSRLYEELTTQAAAAREAEAHIARTLC